MAQQFSIFWIYTTELWMTKYIIGEIFSSGGATLYKNPSDQTVCNKTFAIFKPGGFFSFWPISFNWQKGETRLMKRAHVTIKE